MSPAPELPWQEHLQARERVDAILRWVGLFGRDVRLQAALCLHLELLDTASQLSDERVTTAKLGWWVQTLSAPQLRQRHPLTAFLSPDELVCSRIVPALAAWPDQPMAASIDELWSQALGLASGCASLVQAAPATFALHGLMWRLRLPLAAPHNPGLCPLDLRARYQLAERLGPLDWPVELRRDWLQGLERLWSRGLAVATGAGPAVLQALLARELRRAQHPGWRAPRLALGPGAVWTAWRAALRA